MSKKKTAKTDASPPSILPILKSKSSKAKAKADAAKASPAATEPNHDTGLLVSTEAPAENASVSKKARAKKEVKPKKISCLDAAARVLTDAGTAMTTSEMIDAMAKAKLWSSPNGQTPAATLYSAILRELNTKGDAARFTKTERGKFAAK